MLIYALKVLLFLLFSCSFHHCITERHHSVFFVQTTNFKVKNIWVRQCLPLPLIKSAYDRQTSRQTDKTKTEITSNNRSLSSRAACANGDASAPSQLIFLSSGRHWQTLLVAIMKFYGNRREEPKCECVKVTCQSAYRSLSVLYSLISSLQPCTRAR